MKESEKTIADFGEQWSRYTDNSGFYGSESLFRDIVEPLIHVSEFQGRNVLDIGSGTGRIISMLLNAGAGTVTGVEPSAAFDVLTRSFGDDPRVELVHAPGDQLPPQGQYDLALSIGVLHHVPDPKPVVDAVLQSLRPGGRFIIWLYGWEGNELYLSIFSKLRFITTRIPHSLLVVVVWLLYLGFNSYALLARFINIPMRDYVLNVIGKMSPDKQRLVIYDQLNPCYAKYYKKSEAEALLAESGFVNVQSFHRHEYSWTVVGKKPTESESQ
jgi:SAM-dependent methyltransferase